MANPNFLLVFQNLTVQEEMRMIPPVPSKYTTVLSFVLELNSDADAAPGYLGI